MGKLVLYHPRSNQMEIMIRFEENELNIPISEMIIFYQEDWVCVPHTLIDLFNLIKEGWKYIGEFE